MFDTLLRASLCAMLLLGLTVSVAAQTVPPSEAMQKLDFMVGEWEGEGWMRRGPGEPSMVQVHERIQPKAGGHVLLIEGHGTEQRAGYDEPVTVHDALAVLSYDAQQGRYLLRSFTAEGRYVDADVEMGDEQFVWSFDVPQGHVRYTMTYEEGRWNEIGAFSADSQTWQQFMEMNLTRKD